MCSLYLHEFTDLRFAPAISQAEENSFVKENAKYNGKFEVLVRQVELPDSK